MIRVKISFKCLLNIYKYIYISLILKNEWEKSIYLRHY